MPSPTTTTCPLTPTAWNRLGDAARGSLTGKIEIGRELAKVLADGGHADLEAAARRMGLTVEDAAACVQLALLERGAWRVARVVPVGGAA